MTTTPDPTDFRPPPCKPRWWVWAVVVTVAIIAGYSIGHQEANGPVTTTRGPSSSTPGPTVTVTSPPERVEVTPQVCLDAIDHAYEGFDIAAQMLGAIDPALTAAMSFDQAELDVQLAKMDSLTSDLSDLAPQWQSAATACQGGQ